MLPLLLSSAESSSECDCERECEESKAWRRRLKGHVRRQRTHWFKAATVFQVQLTSCQAKKERLWNRGRHSVCGSRRHNEESDLASVSPTEAQVPASGLRTRAVISFTLRLSSIDISLSEVHTSHGFVIDARITLLDGLHRSSATDASCPMTQSSTKERTPLRQ